MTTKHHTRKGYEPSKYLIPGNSYRLKYDSIILKRDDTIDIFSIERGLKDFPLYACYCSDRDTWEYLDEGAFN